MTTMADGVFQYGGLPVTGGIPPLVRSGSKAFFVDPVNGLDGNPGTSPKLAFASLYKAHKMCTAGNNDTVFLIGDGTAANTARLSTANAAAADSTLTTGKLIWSKSATHLIGITAPGANARARMAPPTGTYTVTTFGDANMVLVSGSGCYFKNLSMYQAFSTGGAAQIGVKVTGSYNIFDNVLMAGMQESGSATDAGSRNLLISGGGENVFSNCQIGTDTVTRTVANASIEFAGGTARNRFYNCVLPIWATGSGVLGILGTGAACMDRYQLFSNSWFINAIKSSGVAMTVCASLTSASAGGMLVFANCNSIGMTKWGDTNALAQSYVSGVGGAATDGLMLNPS